MTEHSLGRDRIGLPLQPVPKIVEVKPDFQQGDRVIFAPLEVPRRWHVDPSAKLWLPHSEGVSHTPATVRAGRSGRFSDVGLRHSDLFEDGHSARHGPLVSAIWYNAGGYGGVHSKLTSRSLSMSKVCA